MTVLRKAKELIPYLLIVCCGLLLASVYFFHGNDPSTWTLFSKLNKSTQLSAYYHGSHKTGEYISNRETNTHLLESNTTVAANISNAETPTNIQSTDTIEFINRKSFQTEVVPLDSTLQKSTFNDLIINVSNLTIHTKLQMLVSILELKLKAITVRRIRNFKPTCDNDFKLANSCDNNKCLQTELPESPTMRVAQLLTPDQLQMSQDEHEILREMADKVSGSYDIILLTAGSSNHFLESQALLKNLHENVYPYLKNFTLIFYNLGLTEPERNLMVKYCQCQVIDFPFHKFPKFITHLRCYAWKPVLIKANLQKSNVVFWMDASIRFHNVNAMYEFIQAARERGVQVGGSSADSPFRTYRSMYHFFGDEPCAYLNLGQAHATLGAYHREYFVDRVILEPWVACALKEDCICSLNMSTSGCRDSKIVAAKYYAGTGNIVYGLCHRFDQSAISLILHKLYQDFYRWVLVPTDHMLSIKRRHTVRYFPEE